MFVFDTETRIDATQRLTFGSYRYIEKNRCVQEGLFYGNDLPDADRRILENYAEREPADTVDEGNPKLLCLTRHEFVERLFYFAYRKRLWFR